MLSFTGVGGESSEREPCLTATIGRYLDYIIGTGREVRLIGWTGTGTLGGRFESKWSFC